MENGTEQTWGLVSCYSFRQPWVFLLSLKHKEALPGRIEASLALHPIILVDHIISMLLRTCRWRVLRFFLAVTLALSTATTVGYTAPPSDLELEVLGKLSLHAQTRSVNDSTWELSGRISDESGRPLGGTLFIDNEQQEREPARTCDTSEGADSKLTRVPATGEFCLLTRALQAGAKLSAQSPHFLPVSVSIYEDKAGSLPPPRFTQTPQVLDLDKTSPVVVELLASGGSYARGAELSLALDCGSHTFQIAKKELAGSHLERFEFTTPGEALRGNCQFLAQSTAPNHPPQTDSRNVLVRSQAHLELKNSVANEERLIVTVDVSAAGGPVVDGLLEARSKGVFLVGAPLKSGQAQIELERLANASAVELAFVPAGSALTSTESITIDVPAKAASFRLTGLHILLLLSFCLWLGYAWLRPNYQARRGLSITLPKKSQLRSTQSKKGPIKGLACDAHTGRPISGVELTIFQTGPTSKEVVEIQTTDSEGVACFETTLAANTLLQLEASHVSYMNLLAPIHGSGLAIHLTERRRALLKNLISWAEQHGRPWNQKPRPTPGDIETEAKRAARDDVTDWAQRVARRAYGPEAPSEGEVDELTRPRNASAP